MVLWLEDFLDILKTINGHKFDYCFLFDHSNGHDRLQPDGLNINKISKYYGGKEPNIRDGEIMNKNYFGPFKHDKLLKVRDVQELTWTDDQKGPYYMTSAMKEMKKFDKSEGKTREVDLTVEELVSSLRGMGVNIKGKKDNMVKLCKNINLPLEKQRK